MPHRTTDNSERRPRSGARSSALSPGSSGRQAFVRCRDRSPRIVLVVTTVFFAAFFLWPLWQILKGGFVDADGRLTFAFLGALLRNPLYLGGLKNSFLLAVATTLLALGLALPLAVVADRYRYPGKTLLTSLVLVPIILPPFVGAIGIKQIFGQYGAFNALLIAVGARPAGWTFDWFAASPFWGVATVEALSLFPLIYLTATSALASVDPAMEEAAASLGCTGVRRFWRITAPLIKPGLFAGSTIVFIWAFTELGVPLIFDYNQVTPVQIYDGLKEIGGNPFPYALVLIMLASSVALYAVGRGLFGRGSHAMMARASGADGPRTLPPLRAWACTGFLRESSLLPCCRISAWCWSRFPAPGMRRSSPPVYVGKFSPGAGP